MLGHKIDGSAVGIVIGEQGEFSTEVLPGNLLTMTPDSKREKLYYGDANGYLLSRIIYPEENREYRSTNDEVHSRILSPWFDFGDTELRKTLDNIVVNWGSGGIKRIKLSIYFDEATRPAITRHLQKSGISETEMSLNIPMGYVFKRVQVEITNFPGYTLEGLGTIEITARLAEKEV